MKRYACREADSPQAPERRVAMLKGPGFDIGWIGRIEPCVSDVAHHLDPKVRTAL
jgi:hypothetical protein